MLETNLFILQIVGGVFYLLNKVFQSIAERQDILTKQKLWKLWSWYMILAGLPAWIIIFVLKDNWIILGLELCGGIGVIFGIVTMTTFYSQTQPQWLDRISTVIMTSGVCISINTFGGLNTWNQFFELIASIGFLVGIWLLTKDNRLGYLCFIIMNISAGALVYNQKLYFLTVLQLISMVFSLDAYTQAKKKKPQSPVDVVLIQPKARWGKHPYLPNGLLAVAARLIHVGKVVKIIDMNVQDTISLKDLENAEWIGIGVLGAPYIPEAFKLVLLLRQLGATQSIFFGGPVVSKLSEQEWNILLTKYCIPDVIPIRNEEELGANLGITNLPSIFNISMSSAIETLSPELLQTYFQKEFCIFTSDGCVFNCTFCAANKGIQERFRDLNSFREEIRTLVGMIRKYAGKNPTYEIYLSTLDGFQNWETMEQYLQVITEECKSYGVTVNLRFLATSRYTHLALQRDPNILTRWHTLYNVVSVGIGVDGSSKQSWQQVRKTHNDLTEIQTVLIELKKSGIIPEAFMILGLPGENMTSTIESMEFCKILTRESVKIRPYVMHILSPGSPDFSITPYMQNINLFSQLDYGCVPSELSHPDEQQRTFLTNQYLSLIDWLNEHNPHGCPTQPLLLTEEGSYEDRIFAEIWNKTMPMDR